MKYPYRLHLLFAVILFASQGCGGDASRNHATYANVVADMRGEIHAHLELGYTEVGDQELTELALPDTIRSVSLRGTKISDAGIAELMRADNLEQLNLNETGATDGATDVLKQLPRLWMVDIATEHLSPAAFGQIRFFLKERVATIANRSSILPLARLPARTVPNKVEEALVPDEFKTPVFDKIHSRYAEHIEALDGELQLFLDFSNTELTDEDLKSLPFTDNVRNISLRGTSVTDDGVRELMRARNLEIVDLSNTQVTEKSLKILKSCPRLWKANVGKTQIPSARQRDFYKFLNRKRNVLEYDTTYVPVRPNRMPEIPQR
jgi:hypothetical protein